MSLEELSEGQRKCLAILMNLGGRATAQQMEHEYKNKYVYDLLDQLEKENYVLRTTGERTVYELTNLGFEVAIQIAVHDRTIIEREVNKLCELFENVMSWYGLKENSFTLLQALLIATSSKEVFTQYNLRFASLHEMVVEILKSCRRNKELKNKLLARWLQTIAVAQPTSQEHGNTELQLSLATRSLPSLLEELIIYSCSRLKWRIHQITHVILRLGTLATALFIVAFSIILLLLYILSIASKA